MKIGETLILAHHMVLLISISMSDQVNKAEKVRLSSKLHIQREGVVDVAVSLTVINVNCCCIRCI